MTSKEALEIIETYNYYNGAEEYLGNKCIHPDYLKAKPLYDKAVNKVERDLEVLEILKNKYVDTWNIKATSTVKRYNETITKYDGCDTFHLTESEYNKVKEWLENGK